MPEVSVEGSGLEQAGPGPQAKSNKRKPYVSRACKVCRKKKIRCDAGQPTCSYCTKHSLSCSYDAEEDGRKTISPSYVQALRDRITALEDQLKPSTTSQELSSSSTSSEIVIATLAEENRSLKQRIAALEFQKSPYNATAAAPSAFQLPISDSRKRARTGSDGTEDEAEEGVDEGEGEGSDGQEADAPLLMDRLKVMDENPGSVRYFGSTSSFAHLPEFELSATANSSKSTFPANNTGAMVSEHSFLPRFEDRDGQQQPAWRRHLPQELEITYQLHEELLQSFAAFFNPWCWMVDIDLFRRDLDMISHSSHYPTRTKYYSPLLHNSILGLACRYVTSIEDEEWTKAFGAQAKTYIQQECEKPMTSTVRGLMLLASIHSGLLVTNIGSLHFGMAIRVAETMGLNVDCSYLVKSGKISAEDALERKKTFWSLYIQDKLWAISLGRSPSVVSHNVPLPTIEAEKDSNPWLPPVFVSTSKNFSRDREGLLSSTFYQTTLVLTIAGEVMEKLYGIGSDATSGKRKVIVSQLYFSLESWWEALPPALKIGDRVAGNPLPHVIILNVMYFFTVILIHRGKYHNSSDATAEDISIRKCDHAASKIVQLLKVYDRGIGLMYSPFTLTHATFAASSILLLGSVRSQIRAPRKLQEQVQLLYQCIQSLKSMRHHWSLQTAKTLEDLRVEWGLVPAPSPAASSGSSTEQAVTLEEQHPQYLLQQQQEPQEFDGSFGQHEGQSSVDIDEAVEDLYQTLMFWQAQGALPLEQNYMF